jgi:hypothetical protein
VARLIIDYRNAIGEGGGRERERERERERGMLVMLFDRHRRPDTGRIKISHIYI